MLPPHDRYKPDADDVHGQHRFTLDSKRMSEDLQVGSSLLYSPGGHHKGA